MSPNDSFQQFYTQHAEAIFGCAMAILKDPFEAQDVVQEVFLQAWNQTDRYDSSRGTIATWLRMVAKSRAIDRLRAIRRFGDPVAASAGEPATEAGDSLDQVLAVERTRSLRHALARLSTKQQRLLELSYGAGLSHSSIARVVNEPLGTVKTHIRQALQTLRDCAGEPPAMRSSVPEPHTNSTLPFTITGNESLRTLPRSETRHAETMTVALRGVRALIVDDDAETRKLTGVVLTRFGAAVDTRASVRSALQAVLFEFDVLIVDLAMPEEDGYTFLGEARALAAQQQRALPPTVAFTASASEDERSRVRLAGFDAYLNKPVHPIALLSTVAALVPRG